MGVVKSKRPILSTARAGQVEDADAVTIDVLQQSEQGGGGGGVSPSIVEKNTGLKWLDGSTSIFEKTVVITEWPDDSEVETAHGITGLDVVVDLFGMLKAASGTWYRFNHNHTVGGAANDLDISVDTTNILFRGKSDWTAQPPTAGWVTIRYTKS
jgi:hypothetical protein